MRRSLGVGAASREAMRGQMPWSGAGTAARSSRELHSSPPGWYSAPKTRRTTPGCAKMGSLPRSVDGFPGWSAAGSASCSLWAGGVGWREACWVGRDCHF